MINFIPLFGIGFSLIIGVYGGLRWQENVYERKIAEIEQNYANTVQEANKRARQNEKYIQDKYEQALHKSNTRIHAMVRDVDSSRSAFVRLRDTTDSALRNAETSFDTCINTANTLRIVFNSCAEEYKSLGTEAQGHVIDKQTLIESWPTLVTDHE